MEARRAAFPSVLVPLDRALALTLISAVLLTVVKVSNHSRTSYQWHRDICSRRVVDAPIVLDDDESDAEPDATTSDDDDDQDQTLESTPPPGANNHQTAIPTIPTKRPSKHSIRDKHRLQDRSHTTTPNHTEAESGLYASYSAITDHDGCEPSDQMEDQQRRKSTRINPTPPNPSNSSSRKRSDPPTGSQAPSPKRPRGLSRVAARKAREVEGMPTHSDSHTKEEKPYVMYFHVTSGTKSGKLSTSAAYA